MYVYSKDWVLVDTVLWAVGRKTNTTVLGCELSGVQVKRGNIVVNMLQNCTLNARGRGRQGAPHCRQETRPQAFSGESELCLIYSNIPSWSSFSLPFPSSLLCHIFTLLPCYKSKSMVPVLKNQYQMATYRLIDSNQHLYIYHTH